jgi:hypothetical protein
MLASCTFCGQPASLGPMPKVHVCRTCAKRIGALASFERGGSTAWSTQAAPPRAAPAESAEVERDLREFKAGVAKQISAEDFESHFDLAEAYREMGLFDDALREAAVVLTTASPKLTAVATKVTELTLRLVLTPPLLKPRGLDQLRRQLRCVN